MIGKKLEKNNRTIVPNVLYAKKEIRYRLTEKVL